MSRFFNTKALLLCATTLLCAGSIKKSEPSKQETKTVTVENIPTKSLIKDGEATINLNCLEIETNNAKNKALLVRDSLREQRERRDELKEFKRNE